MTIAEKLAKITENQQKVYDKGLEAGKELGGYNEGYSKSESDFWDVYQQNGTRYNYQYAFCAVGWNDDTFKPKYDIILGSGYSGTNAFWECYVTDLAATLEKQGVRLDTTLCGYMQGMFQNSHTKRIPELNCTHATDYNAEYGLRYTFSNSSVETIDKLIVNESLMYTSAFQACRNLKNIVFDGVIGQDINFQWSTLLTRASIESIVNHLSDSATGKTLTLSKAAVDEEFAFFFAVGNTSEEIPGTHPDNPYWWPLRNTKSNWEIAYV